MNKKELAEIRKNFSSSSDTFVLNHVVTAVVDAQKNIVSQISRPYHEIPFEEAECLMDTLKRTLSGSLGKGLVEYEFPNTAYEEGGSQQMLYRLLSSKLTDEEAVHMVVEQFAKELEYISLYALIIGHCTYTVFNKTKNDEIDPYQSQEYHFLVVSVCPVEVRVDGLIYNEDDAAIEKKYDYDRIVAEIPSDGFLYPTFTGRGPDVNHVLCFAHNAKKVNISLIERVLGCTFTQTADQQKETFLDLIQETVADELTYDVITGVNEKLRDIAAEYANDPEPPVLDDIHVRDILLDSGVSQEKAEFAQTAFRETASHAPITIANLVESKTTINMEGIRVVIDKECTDKIRVKKMDGRRYLLIDLDNPDVEINGLMARIVQEADETTEEPTPVVSPVDEAPNEPVDEEPEDGSDWL